MTTPDGLDELFNMAINAKEIAVKTADEALEFADNSEIAAEANKLLDRYRVKFKEDLHRLILKERREELKKLRAGLPKRKPGVDYGDHESNPRGYGNIEAYESVRREIKWRIAALNAEIEGSNHD